MSSIKHLATPEVFFCYHPQFLLHDTGSHPEHAGRLEWILEFLSQKGMFDSLLSLQEPVRLAEETLLLAHTQDHVNHIKSLAMQGGGQIDSDTVISEHSFEAALYAAGAGITAAEAIHAHQISKAFCLVRPPGHHATRSRAMGFCLFNNIAILARYLLSKQYAERVAIIDFDAHHGNGTQDIFYQDNDVLYVGLHQSGNTLWPSSGFTDEVGQGKGAGYTVNLPYPPHTSDTEYLTGFRKIVSPILDQFQPDYLLLSAGYDAYHRDPLTEMGLTGYTYYHLPHVLKSVADKYAQGRMIALLEGGYNKQGLQNGVYNTLIGMTHNSLKPILPPQRPSRTGHESQEETFLRPITDILSQYWDL